MYCERVSEVKSILFSKQNIFVLIYKRTCFLMGELNPTMSYVICPSRPNQRRTPLKIRIKIKIWWQAYDFQNKEMSVETLLEESLLFFEESQVKFHEWLIYEIP